MFEEILNREIDTENTYMGQDGLRYCKTCNEPKQCRRFIPLKGERVLGIMCRCDKEREESKRIEAFNNENARSRNKCFRTSAMHKLTFENDDRKNEKLSKFCEKYADGFNKFFSEGKGITFTGNLGAGKSYMAACIANRIIDNGRTALFASIPEICMSLGSEFDGSKQANLERLDKYSLLILDDLGIERDTPSMKENAYLIIDGRIRSGKPLIVTTNLSVSELRNTEDIRLARLYDRILEKSYVLTMKGESRRREASRELQKEALEIFEF